MANKSHTDTNVEKDVVNNHENVASIRDPEIERLSKITFSKVEADKAKEQAKLAEREALKLTRCIINCNNKNKTSLTGEIFCARNAKIAEVKKFIPFGVPTHVPEILLNMIREKKYQMFRKEKLPNGSQITRPFLVPEYTVDVLPPLTSSELEAIKQKQLAEGK